MTGKAGSPGPCVGHGEGAVLGGQYQKSEMEELRLEGTVFSTWEEEILQAREGRHFWLTRYKVHNAIRANFIL